MSIITKLPCEIINAVLRHVGSLQNLSSALLTCRHVYASFQENPRVAVDILRRQIAPELLPYAVAVMEASRQAPAVLRSQALINHLIRELRTQRETELQMKSETSAQLMAMPLPLLSQMSRTQDIIHSFVTEFSSSAWTLLQSSLPIPTSKSVSLSPQEYIRFCRAFYRMELYFRLFPRADSPEEKIQIGHSVQFLRAFPPWENEQIGCALDFLDLQFSRASRDVAEHDVFFGAMSVDYLIPGHTNEARQIWLGRGICFVHQLMRETTYDAKHQLLASTFTSKATDLHETLLGVYTGDTHLDDYSKEQCEALFLPSEPLHDTDRGPFEGWWASNKQAYLRSTIMMDDNAACRDRAYVLWDEDRLKRHGLLVVFAGNVLQSQQHLDSTEDDYEAMLESFDTRSEIYQKGGRGYWSADDESRIIWPEGSGHGH